MIPLLILFTIVIILFILYYFMQYPSSSIIVSNNANIVDNIKLTSIQNFISANDCDHLIELANGKFDRSSVVDGENIIYKSTRTSHTYSIPKGYDDTVKRIERLVSRTVNKPIDCIEQLQVVKYSPGQEFAKHHDWFSPEYRKINGNKQRQYTIFVYLNDVQNGGTTYFPDLNMSFQPIRGNALFWENCKTHNICHTSSLHQGNPPLNETKYGLNIWINFDPV
jgi:prolyl 4-hydroxylase